jgi:hypothetical protein
LGITIQSAIGRPARPIACQIRFSGGQPAIGGVEAAIDACVGDGPEFVRRHVLQAEAGPDRVQPVAENG